MLISLARTLGVLMRNPFVAGVLRLGAVSALLLSAACATVVEGTTQNVTVATDPAGAACELKNDGKLVGAVNPTPGSLLLDRSNDDLDVECLKDGYLPGNLVMSSKFTGTTFGNIILGGGIGILVDAASGANNRYPESVSLVLTPEVFRSQAEVDAHFAKLSQRVEQEADQALKKLEEDCFQQMADSEHCKEGPERIEERRRHELARLAAEKARVTIDPAAARAPDQQARAPAPAPVAAKPVAANRAQVSAPRPSNPAEAGSDCQAAASRLGLDPSRSGCLKVKISGRFDFGRECLSTYNNPPAKRLHFRIGDQLLTDPEPTQARSLVGLDDVVCYRVIAGEGVVKGDPRNRYVIVTRGDRSYEWCENAAGC
ncbi:MAG: hypothetical protein TEF_05145 [Rhizobiales bacterium NRL2]|jgi:hypothetical protein|nr:MAG: hypothetical protein TEF_05145 [Rhizobiales bacterium NRL2]